MITETRQTTVGIIKMYFANFKIFLENPDATKGACISIAKDTLST